MTTSQIATNIVLLVAAAAGHGLILRFAVRVMLEVPVSARTSYGIIAAEYAVGAILFGLAAAVSPSAWKLPAALAFIGLVATGAVLIGRNITLPDGGALGVGNGLLIQFMQVPMVIPFVILLSFIIVPPG
ncbi:MAG: hypothetical protein HYR49_07945 [Gammaproteobacteria bacterium]|nr:hypothetical protein [Gammaproteobacteria bacterium]